MIRFFDEDMFEIYATKDMVTGDELMHKYKSLKWRNRFKLLYSQSNEN